MIADERRHHRHTVRAPADAGPDSLALADDLVQRRHGPESSREDPSNLPKQRELELPVQTVWPEPTGDGVPVVSAGVGLAQEVDIDGTLLQPLSHRPDELSCGEQRHHRNRVDAQPVELELFEPIERVVHHPRGNVRIPPIEIREVFGKPAMVEIFSPGATAPADTLSVPVEPAVESVLGVVGMLDVNMVGNHVGDDSKSPAVGFGDQLSQGLLPADEGLDLSRRDGPVAVVRRGFTVHVPGPEFVWVVVERGDPECRDPEPLEVPAAHDLSQAFEVPTVTAQRCLLGRKIDIPGLP